MTEGSTTTDQDVQGNGTTATRWQIPKPRWLQHKITKSIAFNLKEWLLSCTANLAATRLSVYFDRNTTTDVVAAASIVAAMALGMARGVTLAPAPSSTAPVRCSPATGAYLNNGPMTPAALRACVVRSPTLPWCSLPFQSILE